MRVPGAGTPTLSVLSVGEPDAAAAARRGHVDGEVVDVEVERPRDHGRRVRREPARARDGANDCVLRLSTMNGPAYCATVAGAATGRRRVTVARRNAAVRRVTDLPRVGEPGTDGYRRRRQRDLLAVDEEVRRNGVPRAERRALEVRQEGLLRDVGREVARPAADDLHRWRCRRRRTVLSVRPVEQLGFRPTPPIPAFQWGGAPVVAVES